MGFGKKKLKPAEKVFFLGGRGRVEIANPCGVAHRPSRVQGLTGLREEALAPRYSGYVPAS